MPDLPDVHVALRQCADVDGRFGPVRKGISGRSSKQDPYNFDANLQLGALAKQEQDYAKARKYFERAGETRPGDPGVRYQLALLAIEDGSLDKARDMLEGLTKESPQFLEAHVSLALVYYRLKRPEDSKREREIVQKLTAEAQAKQPGVKPSTDKLP